MIPVTLTTARLILDQPTPADRDLVVEYCRDPLFEVYMNTPWPYEPEHAAHFIEQLVPSGWENDLEYTWAIREAGTFLGFIGYREVPRAIGYWLGAPHRGRGIMTEAATAVVDWLFERGTPTIAWECVPGNAASAAVARKLGFTYTGTGPSILSSRHGTAATAWHGVLAATDSRAEKAGWP